MTRLTTNYNTHQQSLPTLSPAMLGLLPSRGVLGGLAQVFCIRLLGVFSFVRDGVDMTPSGRKAMALLALLATAPAGRRSRKWLQNHLWSDKGESQGAASLRQTLYEIRSNLDTYREVLFSDKNIVALDLTQTSVDILQIFDVGQFPVAHHAEVPQFLEGLDVGDEVFEEWLRDQRLYWADFFDDPQIDDAQTEADDTAPEEISPNEYPEFVRSQKLISPVSSQMKQVFRSPESKREHTFGNAIAVLPFLRKNYDDNLEYISDGISQDLLEGLARLKWLPVISFSSSSLFRGPLRDVVATADQLGARYVAEGEISSIGLKTRIRIRLTNGASGLSLWSNEYELEETGFHSTAQKMLTEIVGIIDGKIDMAEQNRFITSEISNDAFFDHIWRGRWYLNKLTKKDSLLAKKHFDAALAIKPEEPEVLVQLAYWHLYRSWVTRASPKEIDEGVRISQRAMALDPTDARSYFLAGMAEAWKSNLEPAEELLTRSIELNPSLSMGYLQLGSVRYLKGEPQTAIDPIETAIRLSPNDRLISDFFGELAMAHLMSGNYTEAAKQATHAIWLKPGYWYAHVIRIFAYTKLGDDIRRNKAARALVLTGRGWSLEQFSWLPFSDREWVKELHVTTISALERI